MNKLTALISFALVLTIIYIVNFTDLFKHKNIHIYSRISPASGTLMFYLDHPYALTSIEVVSADDAKTNKYPHALWHVVSDSATQPTDTFRYGDAIPGMKPAIATAVPEALERGAEYTVLVQAGGKLKGAETFTIH